MGSKPRHGHQGQDTAGHEFCESFTFPIPLAEQQILPNGVAVGDRGRHFPLGTHRAKVACETADCDETNLGEPGADREN